MLMKGRTEWVCGFTSSSLWFLMPRTKSWRFLSNIRSMLPLTIFKAMSGTWSLLSYGTERLTRGLGGVLADPLHRLSSTRVPSLQEPSLFTNPGQMKARPDRASSAMQRLWQWISVGNGWQNGDLSHLTSELYDVLLRMNGFKGTQTYH